MTKKILIIDDDTRLRNLLGKFLQDNDFEVTLSKDAFEAREILQENQFNLLIVDVMMPKENGIEFSKKFKIEGNQTPILILTARGEPNDRIEGLEIGAEDYLSKPFEPKELLLRINNILRRTNQIQGKNENNFQKQHSLVKFGEFKFNLNNLSLTRNDEFIHLTDSEKKILSILSENKKSLFSREDLAKISGNIDERSIDVQITRLRKKIEKNPKQPQFLQTVRNKGYILQIEN